MKRTLVLALLLSAALAMAWAGMPMVGANSDRSMPTGQMVPPLHESAMNAIVVRRSTPSNPGPRLWDRDVTIDTAYVGDFAVDYSLADGTMWLVEAPLLESIVNVYRSTDHGGTWHNVFGFDLYPKSPSPRVGLVLGEGDSSYVYIFWRIPLAGNGRVGLVRLKPDLSSYDAYYVTSAADSTTDFAVCRDYRSNYNLYCWTVIGANGVTAPFLVSSDFGQTWSGTTWSNAIEPFISPSAGPRVNLACLNAGRTHVTAGFNYNYGDPHSWDYGIVNGDTYQCYKPRIAADNTEPDSLATRWAMYTKSFDNSGNYDARYAVRSAAWNDTWRMENGLSSRPELDEGVGDLQHDKAIGTQRVDVSLNQLVRSGGDTSNSYWLWSSATNPFAWNGQRLVNDSGAMVAWIDLASRLVYSPGAPVGGAGEVYARAGAYYLDHGLYFNAPWPMGIAEQQSARPALFGLRATQTGNGVRLAFDNPAAGKVSLRVFDAAGRRARSEELTLSAGQHTLDFDGTSAGIYFAQLQAAGRTATAKFVLAR